MYSLQNSVQFNYCFRICCHFGTYTSSSSASYQRNYYGIFLHQPSESRDKLFFSFASVTQVAGSVNLLGKTPCGRRFVHPNKWPCLRQPADAVIYNKAIFFSAPTHNDCNSEPFKYTWVRNIVAYIEAPAAGDN